MKDEATAQEPAIGALGGELRSVVSALYRRYRSQRPRGELGDAALDILLRLQKAGPLTLTELSERARVSLGSMSQPLRRLEELGYVDRARDTADRRRVLLMATESGSAIAAEVRASVAARVDQQIALLSPAERARLASAIPILQAIAGTNVATPTQPDAG